MVCKQTGGRILNMKDNFSILNLHGMQINRWRSITDEGRLFYINGIPINKIQQPPWYANKQVVNFNRWRAFFYINGMQVNKSQIISDEGHLLYIKAMETKRCRVFTDQGHVFFIELPGYANKHVENFCRWRKYFLHS